MRRTRLPSSSGNRAQLPEPVSELDFDIVIHRTGESMSLRMIHVHMIQEYAPHNGHADLLREAIDGTTGR